MGESPASPAPTGRHQRSIRNYLLDQHFQLKYTGYLLAIAMVLSVTLGALLWRTGRGLLEQSRQTVAQGDQVVALGREVVKESQKVSQVVQMNIVKDEVYKDDPDLAEAFKKDAEAQDQRLAAQQRKLEEQADSLKRQSLQIESQQRVLFTTLFAVLGLLVIGIGIAGIIVTHRVAGPIFKMKRQLLAVGDGSLRMPGKLRKGDELVHFFEAFETMVDSLRKRQAYEISLLDEAITRLDGKADDSLLQPLRDLRADMQGALEK